MAGYTPNCACTTTQTTVQANQANYITLNGRQVLKQYFSQDQNKMVYAHADPSVSGGIIYKAQKPHENSSSHNSNSVRQRTQTKDGFSNQASTKLVPTGSYDHMGRPIYRREAAQAAPRQDQFRSSESNSSNRSQASQAQSLTFQKNQELMMLT